MYQRRKDSFRSDYSKYYAAYRDLRNAYIAEHPLDELLLLDDRVVPAEEVHHIVPISYGKTDSQRMQIALCSDNLIALSRTIHSLVHNNPDALTYA